MSRVLYISYDGLLETISQSQVLPYVRGLARRHEMTLVTFEKKRDWDDEPRRRALQREVAAAGIRWTALRYHKRPTVPATACDVAQGLAACVFLARRDKAEIVHARGYVASLIALALKRAMGLPFIFDMRGFWADQRADCGAWAKDSLAYRLAKHFERRFLTRADVVVSLTRSAVEAMREFPCLRDRSPRFEVIPTCTDLEVFQPADDGSAGRTNGRPFTLCCLGTVSHWYLLDDMIECFAAVRELRPDARLCFFNRDDHDLIRRRLKACAIPEACVTIKAITHAEVPAQLRAIDAGVFVLKSFFSMKAVAPTKLGEFLACGVPCLANSGAGDFAEILEERGAGVVLRGLTRQAKREAAAKLVALAADPGTRRRCADAARRHFSLADAVRAYDEIYESLSGVRRPSSLKTLILCPYPRGSAQGQRFRFEQYLDVLRRAGIEVDVRPFLPQATMDVLYEPGHYLLKVFGVIAGFLRRFATLFGIFRYDRVFIYREASPLGPPIFEWLLFLLDRPVIYDFDDAIFHPNVSAANGLIARLKWHSKVAYTVKRSRKVSVSNSYLLDWASAINPRAMLLPSTIDASRFTPSRKRGLIRGAPVIGWTGSHSTAKYLELIRPVLMELQKRRDFEFRVICEKDPGFPELKKYRFVEWRLESLVEDLEPLDIGLMPVPEGAWELGKMGFKAVQYSALEIAPVVSDVGSGSEIVAHEKTGLVVRNTRETWIAALENLVDSPERIRRFGQAARESVLKTFTTAAQAPRYAALFAGREAP